MGRLHELVVITAEAVWCCWSVKTGRTFSTLSGTGTVESNVCQLRAQTRPLASMSTFQHREKEAHGTT